MPGTMSKEDVPGRSASLTFTIDNILNLKRQRRAGEPDAPEEQEQEQRDGTWRSEEAWDVPRRCESGSIGTGNCTGI